MRAQRSLWERKGVLALLIFILALGLRIGLYFIPRDVNRDVYYILEIADYFFQGGYRVLGEQFSRFMPLYPFLIAVLHQVLHLPYLFASRLIPLLLSGFSPVLLLFWTGKDREEFKVNLLASLFFCFSGFNIIYGSQGGTDGILGFWILLGFLLFKRKQNSLSGMIMGLAYLSRPEGVLALLVLLLLSWSKPREILAILFGFLLMSSPWLIYSWRVFGIPGATDYFRELFAGEHSGFKFISDLALGLGPIALVLAMIGWVNSDREDQKLLGGFLVLYCLLHFWWWWSGVRFSESLRGIIYLLSARGIFALIEKLGRFERRRAVLVFLLGLIIMGEQALIGIYTGRKIIMASRDPYLKACQSLAGHKEGNILCAFPLVAKFESGLLGVDLKEYQKGISQDQFVLEKILEQKVHWLIWYSKGAWDTNYFPFLSQGESREVLVDYKGRAYILVYDFYQVFRNEYYYVYIYELSVRSL